MIVALGILMFSGCDAVDDCLDAGGAWDDERDQCVCTDQERQKSGDVSADEAMEKCTVEYEAINAQKSNSE